MRNKLAILTLLILFIVSISCVSAEDSNSVSVLSDSNSDVYVSPTGNDNNVGDVNNPFATINKAIDSNVSNIHLSEGKFIGTGNNGLTIENKSITIIGAGADKTIIDLNKTQFMDIKSTSSVVLTNLTIINGYTKYGGAIYHDSNVLTLKDCIFENNKADDGDDIYGYIAPNGITGGLCLNMSNTLTLVSTNSSSIRSELKAIFDLDGLKVSGYNIKFYLNGVYKGSAPLVNGVATFVAVANDGKYEISASGDYINKTTVVKGVLNVDANPVSVFDVYVSGTGSDESGDGSLAKPFATIKKHLNTECYKTH